MLIDGHQPRSTGRAERSRRRRHRRFRDARSATREAIAARRLDISSTAHARHQAADPARRFRQPERRILERRSTSTCCASRRRSCGPASEEVEGRGRLDRLEQRLLRRRFVLALLRDQGRDRRPDANGRHRSRSTCASMSRTGSVEGSPGNPLPRRTASAHGSRAVGRAITENADGDLLSLVDGSYITAQTHPRSAGS